jgi:protein-S-isoprenylcysteine O-methyltransferase Ste14
MSDGFVLRGGWWVVGQILLLLAIAGLDLTGHAATKPFPVLIGGLVLIAAATLCSLAGLLALGRNLTPFPKPSAKTELVQHGIYRLIRHPLYTSVFCASVGSALIFQSWPASVASVALGIFFDAKARQEERWLRRRFPDYSSYESRVRRFIPWLY